jgi:hypothetical protein
MTESGERSDKTAADADSGSTTTKDHQGLDNLGILVVYTISQLGLDAKVRARYGERAESTIHRAKDKYSSRSRVMQS